MFERTAFADTSALYPLFAPNDPQSSLCKEVLKELLDDYKVQIVTTEWVHFECLSKLRKHGIECCELFEEIIRRDVLKVNTVTKQLTSRALELFWNYRDKSWGIVDCVSIAFMYENNLYYVFANDAHFRQAGLFPLITIGDRGAAIKAYSQLIFQ
jgi:predicted nucleic acid-binding protein